MHQSYKSVCNEYLKILFEGVTSLLSCFSQMLFSCLYVHSCKWEPFKTKEFMHFHNPVLRPRNFLKQVACKQQESWQS